MIDMIKFAYVIFKLTFLQSMNDSSITFFATLWHLHSSNFSDYKVESLFGVKGISHVWYELSQIGSGITTYGFHCNYFQYIRTWITKYGIWHYNQASLLSYTTLKEKGIEKLSSVRTMNNKKEQKVLKNRKETMRDQWI